MPVPEIEAVGGGGGGLALDAPEAKSCESIKISFFPDFQIG